jgi:hypothetical protein
MITFDQFSCQYWHKALVQRAAAEKLPALLNLGGANGVLPAACGGSPPGSRCRRSRGRKFVAHQSMPAWALEAGLDPAGHPALPWPGSWLIPAPEGFHHQESRTSWPAVMTTAPSRCSPDPGAKPRNTRRPCVF